MGEKEGIHPRRVAPLARHLGALGGVGRRDAVEGRVARGSRRDDPHQAAADGLVQGGPLRRARPARVAGVAPALLRRRSRVLPRHKRLVCQAMGGQQQRADRSPLHGDPERDLEGRQGCTLLACEWDARNRVVASLGERS